MLSGFVSHCSEAKRVSAILSLVGEPKGKRSSDKRFR